MSTQRQRIEEVLRDHPEGVTTEQVAKLLDMKNNRTAASAMSKGNYYGWWKATSYVEGGARHMLWKAMEPESTGA